MVRIVAAVNAPTVDALLSLAETAYRCSGEVFARIGSAFRLDPIRQLAVLLVVLSAGTLAPARTPEVPARVVYAPGQGWVDAANVPGLPGETPDGAVLRYAWSQAVGAATPLGGAYPNADSARSISVAADSEGATGDVAAGQVALGGRVSLNRASMASLEGLPGVGPALAARIVAGRPYRSAAELDRIKGIGPKTVEKLAPLIEP